MKKTKKEVKSFIDELLFEKYDIVTLVDDNGESCVGVVVKDEELDECYVYVYWPDVQDVSDVHKENLKYIGHDKNFNFPAKIRKLAKKEHSIILDEGSIENVKWTSRKVFEKFFLEHSIESNEDLKEFKKFDNLVHGRCTSSNFLGRQWWNDTIDNFILDACNEYDISDDEYNRIMNSIDF